MGGKVNTGTLYQSGIGTKELTDAGIYTNGKNIDFEETGSYAKKDRVGEVK